MIRRKTTSTFWTIARRGLSSSDLLVAKLYGNKDDAMTFANEWKSVDKCVLLKVTVEDHGERNGMAWRKGK